MVVKTNNSLDIEHQRWIVDGRCMANGTEQFDQWNFSFIFPGNLHHQSTNSDRTIGRQFKVPSLKSWMGHENIRRWRDVDRRFKLDRGVGYYPERWRCRSGNPSFDNNAFIPAWRDTIYR